MLLPARVGEAERRRVERCRSAAGAGEVVVAEIANDDRFGGGSAAGAAQGFAHHVVPVARAGKSHC